MFFLLWSARLVVRQSATSPVPKVSYSQGETLGWGGSLAKLVGTCLEFKLLRTLYNVEDCAQIA